MTQNCPKTCNLCGGTTTPPTNCVDNATSNCPSMSSYCNNALYYNLMTQQCPKTCNRCGVTVNTTTTTAAAPPPTKGE